MLIELCSPVDLELIEMSQALNRIVGEEVVATVALPPFPASIKDGYAVHSADGAGTRRVRAAVVAGSSNSALSGQFEAVDWRLKVFNLKHSNRKSPKSQLSGHKFCRVSSRLDLYCFLHFYRSVLGEP